MHPADLDNAELLKECEVRRTKRGGPGGQHRNKVETAVVIRHQKTKIIAEANERRSQHENQAVALFRLRVNLALEYRSTRPSDAIPSSLWQRRCRGGKISVAASHEEFPSVLAEALDVLQLNDFDVAAAAERLECSRSQLVKLLKIDPRFLAKVNGHRAQRNQFPYR